MTPEQADALLDAVIACRATSRHIMMANDRITALAAENADDTAFKTVTNLIKEATT